MEPTAHPHVRLSAHPPPAEQVLQLIARARAATSSAALRFIAVNDSHLLAPYQQAALWFAGSGVAALSGVLEVEANAPYAQWVRRVAAALPAHEPRLLRAGDLPAELAADWSDWLPEYGLWVPFPFGHGSHGGLLLAREQPWRPAETAHLREWLQTWARLYEATARPGVLAGLRARVAAAPRLLRRRPLLVAAALLALALVPVRLSVLAPAELVPAEPAVVRAPLDGIVKTFFVRPNDAVRAGQPLFAYDEAANASRLEVAVQALRTAEAEERQYAQLALTDAKARAALATARGQVEERRLEVDYLRGQLQRTQVTAPQDGLVFLDDALEWVGRPVTAGQRLLRLARADDQEIEAWLPVGDAIALPVGAPVKLYLSASPLAPVSGTVRYVAYEAVRRPDGQYAYRVRATLAGPIAHRTGLKGTARLSGSRVPFVYWVVRRPLAAAREHLGI